MPQPNKQKNIYWLALCLLLMPLEAIAGLFEQGEAAMEAGDNKRAASLFQSAAIEGIPQAQFMLGTLYETGKGVAQDTENALMWYKKAAIQGHTLAQYNLGNAYFHGRGTAKDEQHGLYWWQKAAEKGVIKAQHNLGLYYLKRRTGVSDQRFALAWLLTAERNGNKPSSQLLDQIREHLPPDYLETEWLATQERGEVMILNADPTLSTIQLASLSSLDAIPAMIQKYAMGDQALVYRSHRNEELRYIVVHGFYKTAGAARAGIKKLHPTLQRDSPWIRDLAGIQQQIHANQVAKSEFVIDTTQATRRRDSKGRFVIATPAVARIRAQPSLQGKIIARVTKGTKLPFLQQRGKWFQVRLTSGGIGWGHYSVLSPFESKPTTGHGGSKDRFVVATPAVARIRAQPSLQRKIIARIRKWTKLPLLQQQGDWFQVRLQNGEIGWGHRSVLSPL